MTIFDRYLFSLCFKNLIIVLGFFIVLIIIQDVYGNLLDLLRAKFPLVEIYNFFMYGIIEKLVSILPITFFISVILTVSSLHNTQQLTILKSSGLSLWRISLSFAGIALIISIAIYLISTFIAPLCIEKKQLLEETLSRQYIDSTSSSHLSENEIFTYHNKRSNRLWFIENFNAKKMKGGYTILHQMNKLGTETSRIIAEKSFYDNDLKTWNFQKGTELIFDTISGDPIQSKVFENKQFITLNEDPRDALLLNKNPNKLSLNQTKRVLTLIDEGNPKRTIYLIHLLNFFASCLLPFIFLGISIPLLTRSVKANYFMLALYPLLLFLLFFIIKGLCLILGKNYILPATLSIFLPYSIFLILSTKLYWKE
mgnify:CR=1 FL=1